MSQSKPRPVLFFLALLAPQVLIGAIIFWGGSNPHDYLLAIRDKHEVAQSTHSPKIILAGGSSVCFGSNSEIFSKQCNLPCINLGINAGQGLDFRFNETEYCTEPGDTVVLTLEYLELGDNPDGRIIAKTIANCPECVRFMSWREWRFLLDEGIFSFMAERTRNAILGLNGKAADDVYDVRNFNKVGDFVGHHDKESESGNWVVGVPKDVSQSTLALAKFVKAADKEGVKVFYRMPCIPNRLVKNQMPELRMIESKLKSVFGDRMLNGLEETLLDDEVFFDTAYHLKSPEKNRQSEILAKRLAEKLRSAK